MNMITDGKITYWCGLDDNSSVNSIIEKFIVGSLIDDQTEILLIDEEHYMQYITIEEYNKVFRTHEYMSKYYPELLI